MRYYDRWLSAISSLSLPELTLRSLFHLRFHRWQKRGLETLDGIVPQEASTSCYIEGGRYMQEKKQL